MTSSGVTRRGLLATTALAAFFASVGRDAYGQTFAARRVTPNLIGRTRRPLRYRPEAGAFVIENGAEFFNRPLYGGNSGFRVDGGDRPEFALYLPGRGGNLRFAIRTASAERWLHEAATIAFRYLPGELHYEIRDPQVLGPGVIRLVVLAYAETEGLIVRVDAEGVPAGAELIWVYGGVTGQRGARDGDIGTERVPISEYFQFQPSFAEGNRIELFNGGARLTAPAATIHGTATEGARWRIADAGRWNNISNLMQPGRARTPSRPIAVGRAPLTTDRRLHVSLQRLARGERVPLDLETYRAVTAGAPAAARSLTLPEALPPAELPQAFERTLQHFAQLRDRVRIHTPDPYLDAAMSALNVAADALWDASDNAVMHGAIAWRTKLLGWRGPYVLDALGWPDRARANFAAWTRRQNTNAIPAQLPPADENANLARNEAGLHSNGDLSNSHYDMNMVFVDAMFRHLLWTGDRAFAREVWPVIERHLAWERRLFRREFGPRKLPLYEAYATIWASDDVQYGGGGVAYSSSYNLYHHRMAARVARLLGEDAASYEAEADAIAEAMRTLLWLPDRGAFAEFKDCLGAQLVHESAGLWSFYHTMDSGVPTPHEAWRMADALLRDSVRIPVHGPGVPAGDHYVLPTTDWMPYSWSVNNVVMGENLHTALALWQDGHSEEAFVLTKGALLASMFMGISPGNVGSMNYLDVYRRESQRDFADGAGVMARAMVEGLFGVRPDALAGELTLAPGFPAEWESASMVHPELSLEYARSGNAERWRVAPSSRKFSTLRLRVPARGERVWSVTVNGAEAAWRSDPDAVGRPILEITCPLTTSADIVVEWSGNALPRDLRSTRSAFTRVRRGDFTWWAPPAVAPVDEEPRSSGFDWTTAVNAPTEAVDLTPRFNDRVTNIFAPGKYRTPRSPFVSLALPAQGIGAWAGHVNASAEIDDTGLRAIAARQGGVVMQNGVRFATPGPGAAPNILFVSQWSNYPTEGRIALTGRAAHAFLLMAGSTNHMQSRLDNAELVFEYADGSSARLALRNPETWWPIEQDYFIDDYQFRYTGALPPRVDLKTGAVRLLDPNTFKGQGGAVPGGAATVLELALDPRKPLRAVTLRALANDVVVGLMALTLKRPNA